MNTLRRTLHPEIKILDANKGLVEYVASDETLDSYKEVIRASGWKFDHFEKNAPFVDSHNYGSFSSLVGRVVDFEVARKKLVETVQWAKDVAENTLAQLGWKMTEAGFLKAVSVGFWPVKMVTKWDQDPKPFQDQADKLGLDENSGIRTIYLEQQQVELSAVIIGANPNALAKAYKAGVLDDAMLDKISTEQTERYSRATATQDAQAIAHRARQRRRFLDDINKLIKRT